MRAKLLLACFLSACLMPCCAHAWNGPGHMAVAEIAYQELKKSHPEILAKVLEALKQHPRLDDLEAEIPDQISDEDHDHLLFLVCATWPDMVRTPDHHDPEDHPEWHFVDYPFDLDQKNKAWPAPDESPWAAGSDPKNVLQALDKCRAELKGANTSADQRSRAYCWVLHLIGDIHQPLHCATCFSDTFPKNRVAPKLRKKVPAFKNGDRGGNSYYLDDKFDDDSKFRAKLHSFWDGLLGSAKSLEGIRKNAEKITEAHPRGNFPQLGESSCKAWAHESFEIAKSMAYANGDQHVLPIFKKPSDDYKKNAQAAAAKQAALAGYRLADFIVACAGSH